MVTSVIVKRALNHSVLCSLAFFSIYRNLCGKVAGSSLGTNLSLTLHVSLFSRHHLVVTATSSSWSSATPAGSSSRMWRDCHAKSYADYSAALTISFLANLVSSILFCHQEGVLLPNVWLDLLHLLSPLACGLYRRNRAYFKTTFWRTPSEHWKELAGVACGWTF